MHISFFPSIRLFYYYPSTKSFILLIILFLIKKLKTESLKKINMSVFFYCLFLLCFYFNFHTFLFSDTMSLKTIDKKSDGVLPDTLVVKITHLNINSLTVEDDSTSATIRVQNYDIQTLSTNCCYAFVFLEVREGEIWVRKISCFETVQT